MCDRSQLSFTINTETQRSHHQSAYKRQRHTFRLRAWSCECDPLHAQHSTYASAASEKHVCRQNKKGLNVCYETIETVLFPILSPPASPQFRYMQHMHIPRHELRAVSDYLENVMTNYAAQIFAFVTFSKCVSNNAASASVNARFLLRLTEGGKGESK